MQCHGQHNLHEYTDFGPNRCSAILYMYAWIMAHIVGSAKRRGRC